MEQSEDSGSATEHDCKAAVRRQGVAIGNEEIQQESCRSEESQVDHARLQLDRVHDARVAGENRVQQGQHQHAANKEIYGARALHEDRLHQRRRCERFGSDKAGESDNRMTRCQQPHSIIVAVPLGDERRHRRGGVAAQCIIQRCKQRAPQGVDQIHSQSTATRSDECGPKIAACSPDKQRAEGGDPQRIAHSRIPHHIGRSGLRCDEVVSRLLEVPPRQQPDRQKTNAERDDQRHKDE